jgi:hypothetical protein
MVHQVISVFGSVVVLLSCADAFGQLEENDTSEPPVARDCLQRSDSLSSCICLTREAQTRFTDEELHLVIGRSESRFSIQLDQSNLDLIEQGALLRRVKNADQVIRQACGIGLLVPDLNDEDD